MPSATFSYTPWGTNPAVCADYLTYSLKNTQTNAVFSTTRAELVAVNNEIIVHLNNLANVNTYNL